MVFRWTKQVQPSTVLVVDQTVPRDHLVSRQRQPNQQRSPSSTRHRHNNTINTRLHRPEQTKLKRTAVDIADHHQSSHNRRPPPTTRRATLTVAAQVGETSRHPSQRPCVYHHVTNRLPPSPNISPVRRRHPDEPTMTLHKRHNQKRREAMRKTTDRGRFAIEAAVLAAAIVVALPGNHTPRRHSPVEGHRFARCQLRHGRRRIRHRERLGTGAPARLPER
jgi:hypothetical protein